MTTTSKDEGGEPDPLFLDLWALFERTRADSELRAWLKSMAASESLLSQAALLSYQHPNGHVKITLAFHGRDRPSLRLHVWPKGMDRQKMDAHSHAWSFRSRVLAGALTNLHYEVSDQAKGAVAVHEHLIDLPCKVGDAHAVRYVRSTHLRPTTRRRLARGSEYGFGPELIHRTIPSAAGAVTLFLQLPFSATHSRFFQCGRADIDRRKSDPLSVAKIRGVLEGVAHLV